MSYYYFGSAMPKRQRLVPFPRTGKRQAHIPCPRIGKRSAASARFNDLYLSELLRAAKQSENNAENKSAELADYTSEPAKELGRA